jgi:hypothetical protein
MGTQSEALSCKRGKDWIGRGTEEKRKLSIRLYFHKYKPYILGLHTT